MPKCPVCGKENTALQCSCGFDISRDYEGYPTLVPLDKAIPSRAAFGANLKDLLRCDCCGGFSFQVSPKTSILRCTSCGTEQTLKLDSGPVASPRKEHFCNPAIAVGDSHTVGLKSDGTVIAIGNNRRGQCNVEAWTNIVAISAFGELTAALRKDGTVLTCGWPQCDTSNWTDVIDISVGEGSILGLRQNGTVVQSSSNFSRQHYDLKKWKDIICITSQSYSRSFGVKRDGSVVAVTPSSTERSHVSNWKNMASLAASYRYVYGLTNDGTIRTTSPYGSQDIYEWKDITAIALQFSSIYGLKKDGTVVTTNHVLRPVVSQWRNVIAIDAGTSHVVALLQDGTVVAAGDNPDGQCNVFDWKLI